MEEKKSLKERISDFFKDDTKRIVFVVSSVSIIIIASIIIAIIFVNKDNEYENDLTTTTTTTTTKVSDEKTFRGFKISNLNENDYSLDIKSRHQLTYADNKTDYIYTCIDDNEYIYELSIVNNNLQFKELKYDKNYKGQVYTGNTYTYKLTKKITDFIVGHNCTNVEYTLVVLDEDKSIYTYQNTLDSNIGIEEIIKSFTKFKSISTPKKIGYYDYKNDPFMECPLSTMVYVDKNNDVRVIDSKNTLFYNTVFYKYLGDESKGEVLYILNNKTMIYSTSNNPLTYNNIKLEYKGGFYNDDGIYIIDANNYLYKIDEINEDTSTKIKPLNKSRIVKIGSREVNQNNHSKELYTVKIQFEDGNISEFKNAYEYEILT